MPLAAAAPIRSRAEHPQVIGSESRDVRPGRDQDFSGTQLCGTAPQQLEACWLKIDARAKCFGKK